MIKQEKNADLFKERNTSFEIKTANDLEAKFGACNFI